MTKLKLIVVDCELLECSVGIQIIITIIIIIIIIIRFIHELHEKVDIKTPLVKI